MRNFNEKKLNKNENDKSFIDDNKINSDIFLSDAKEFLDLLKMNSIYIINPELAEKIKEALEGLKSKWPNSTLEEKKEIFDEYYKLYYEYTSYMNTKGKNDLLKLRIELALDSMKKIKENSSKNLKSYKELIADLREYQETLNQIPEIGNHPKILEIIQDTEYYLQKDEIKRIKKNKEYNIPEEIVMNFKSQILRQAYDFLQLETTDSELIDLKREVKLAVAYNNLNDYKSISNIFNLLIEIEYNYDLTDNKEIELKILPDLTEPELNSIELELNALLDNIKKSKVFNREGYELYLNKLTKLKLIYFMDKANPKNLTEFNQLKQEYETYMKDFGIQNIYEGHVSTTIKRIEDSSDEELFDLIEEIKTDELLSKNKNVNVAIRNRYLNYSQNHYDVIKSKHNEEIKDIMIYKDDIENDARLILLRSTLMQLDERDQRVIDDIKEILELELDEFNLLRLLSYIEVVGANDYETVTNNQAYKLLFPLKSDYVSLKRDRGSFVEYSLINYQNSRETNTSLVIKEPNYMELSNEFFTYTMSEYSFYKTFLLFPEMIDQTIKFILIELNRVNNRLVPKSLINNNIDISLIAIEAIKKNLSDNEYIITSLKDEKKFKTLRYVIEDYKDNSDLNKEIKAKNSLVSLIPEIAGNIEGVLETLNVFFSYYEDFELIDKLFKENIEFRYKKEEVKTKK